MSLNKILVTDGAGFIGSGVARTHAQLDIIDQAATRFRSGAVCAAGTYLHGIVNNKTGTGNAT